MSTQPIDFSSIGGKPVQQAPIDFSSIGGKRVEENQPAQNTPEATIGAQPEPTGVMDRFAQWTEKVSNDIKHGTDLTGIGTVLKKMGAHGVYNGNPEAVGDFMASLPLGLLKASKGAAEMQQAGKVMQGAGNVISGGLQATTIPSAFVAPEGAEAAAALPGKVAGAVSEAIPSVERAGQNFQSVMATAKNRTVPITDQLSSALSRYQELVDRGGSRSLAVTKLLKRITDPEQAPMTYHEARDFASNVSRLSADEYQRLSNVMRQQVGAIRVALNDAVGQAASAAGKGEEYVSAMKEYAKAMRLKDIVERGKKIGEKLLVRGLQAAGAGAAGAIGYDIYREVTK